MDEAENSLKESATRNGVLEGQVALLHSEREALRAEALDYAQHIAQLEAQLKALIEQQRKDRSRYIYIYEIAITIAIDLI